MFRWLRKPAAPPGDPDTIQHYRLTRKLGEGGMGLVFEAREGGLHCPPALGDPWFEPVRAEPEFVRSLRLAEEGHMESARALADAGGERILGVAGVAR